MTSRRLRQVPSILPVLVRPLFSLLIGLLMVGGERAHAADTYEVVLGFYDSGKSVPPKELRVNEDLYRLYTQQFPIDRVRVRTADAVYVESFPAGSELFRDDQEAFDAAANDGAVIFLFAGADANRETLSNANYLGRRFGFRFGDEVAQGDILPDVVGQGPMDGNVWLCSQGARTVEVDGPDWRVHYRAAAGAGGTVIASRKWGKGLIVVSGTREIERQSGGRSHNALTLVLWGLNWSKNPQPVGVRATPVASVPTPAPTSAAGEQPTPPPTPAVAVAAASSSILTRDEVQRIVENPASDSLAERVKTMRILYAGSDKAGKLTGRSLLIPRDKRGYFPRMMGVKDIDGKPASTSDFEGHVALVVYWATWDSRSKTVFEELATVVRQYEGKGAVMLGISLDSNADAIRRFRDETGLKQQQICDGQGFNSALATPFEIKSVPRVYLLDRGGRIAATDLPGIAMTIAIDEVLTETR